MEELKLPPLVKAALHPADEEYDLDYSECVIDDMFLTLVMFDIVSPEYRDVVPVISASYREIGSYYTNTVSEIKWSTEKLKTATEEECQRTI